ncbi:MAG: ankyrin repeat domain-containing protein [Candidatus Babeliales bacterium]
MKKYILVSLFFLCLPLGRLDAMKGSKRGDDRLIKAILQIDRSKSVAQLINDGADIEAPEGPARSTPLILAALRADLGAMQALLNAGADVNAKDDLLNTPLHAAVESGNAQAVKMILEARPSNIDAVNEFDETPLLKAAGPARTNNTLSLELLIKAGANYLAKDKEGNTALHYAAQTGRSQATMLLLKKGIDINARNSVGQTPLHNVGNAAVAVTLIEAGADGNALDKFRTTPFALALHKHETAKQMMEVLEKGPERVARALRVVRAFITSVSPQQVQHIIPTIIGATRSGAEIALPKDIRLLIAKELIPAIVRERLALAKLYLPGASPQELEQEIRQSINRVIKKLPYTGELDKKAKEQVVQFHAEDLYG